MEAVEDVKIGIVYGHVDSENWTLLRFGALVPEAQIAPLPLPMP